MHARAYIATRDLLRIGLVDWLAEFGFAREFVHGSLRLSLRRTEGVSARKRGIHLSFGSINGASASAKPRAWVGKPRWPRRPPWRLMAVQASVLVRVKGLEWARGEARLNRAICERGGLYFGRGGKSFACFICRAARCGAREARRLRLCRSASPGHGRTVKDFTPTSLLRRPP